MSDSENHIFEPDVVLSSELFASRSGLRDPERSLMIAVLEEASRCFLKLCNRTDRKQRALYEEARDWFASTERSHLFAFENVCDVLGITPEYLRDRLFRLHDQRCTDSHAPPAESGEDGDGDAAEERIAG